LWGGVCRFIVNILILYIKIKSSFFFKKKNWFLLVPSIFEIVYQPCFSHNLLYIRILDADMERKLIRYMNQHLNTNLNVNFEDNIYSTRGSSTLNLRADVKPVMRNVENSWSALPSSLNFDFLVSNLILRFNHSFFSYSESREPLFFGVFELWRVESVSTLSLSSIFSYDQRPV
jgi:hypothetical protein